MAYNKTAWTDRVVEKPLTFTLQDNGDGTTTLIPSEGNIIQAGTPITSANLNKLETQYEQVFTDLANYQEVKVTDDNGETIDKVATDPNALTSTGWYEFSSTAPNMPVAGFGWIIEHLQASSSVGYQIAFQISTANRVFYRRKSAGTWETWREIARLDQVAPLSHSHTISQITDLQTSLNAKANKSGDTFTGDVYAPSYWENGLRLSSKYAPYSHTHTIANITDLQTNLNNKMDKVTTATESGFCGIGCYTPVATTNAVAGVGVNFRSKKSYTPSSITLSALSSTASALTTQITTDGFWLYINGTNVVNVYLYWRGTYSA